MKSLKILALLVAFFFDSPPYAAEAPVQERAYTYQAASLDNTTLEAGSVQQDSGGSEGFWSTMRMVIAGALTMAAAWLIITKDERDEKRRQEYELLREKEQLYAEAIVLKDQLDKLILINRLNIRASIAHLNALRNIRAGIADVVSTGYADINSLDVNLAHLFVARARDLVNPCSK
jgi:hypothetical protein